MTSDTWDDSIFRRGAIRSKTVSRLSGATSRQLQYWHSTKLILATVVRGSRGTPRLYSWVDYMKARAAVKLLRGGVSSHRLRAYIEWLETNVPDWYKRPLGVLSDRAFVEVAPNVVQEASSSPQTAFRSIAIPVLLELMREGPLGLLRSFARWIDMDPRIHGGSPVVRGTRLETQFLRELKDRGETDQAIAARYKLSTVKVTRALDFESEVVAAA